MYPILSNHGQLPCYSWYSSARLVACTQMPQDCEQRVQPSLPANQQSVENVNWLDRSGWIQAAGQDNKINEADSNSKTAFAAVFSGLASYLAAWNWTSGFISVQLSEHVLVSCLGKCCCALYSAIHDLDQNEDESIKQDPDLSQTHKTEINPNTGCRSESWLRKCYHLASLSKNPSGAVAKCHSMEALISPVQSWPQGPTIIPWWTKSGGCQLGWLKHWNEWPIHMCHDQKSLYWGWSSHL